MKNNSRIILAIAGLALAALACQAATGAATDTPVAPIDTGVPGNPTESQPSGGDVILIDDFSSARWGTGTDADSSVEYANEALQMIVYSTNYFVWSTPNDQDYQNVHMEVTVLNNDTDSTTAFGLMCNQQAASDSSFYYFAMTPAGEYAIAKAEAGQTDIFLTNNDEWAVSDLIARNASSYRVGADCGNGTLTLYVDAQQVASVSDSSYTDGGVAVFTWSGEEATTTDVFFDDFVMRELP
ncbi:MAG TPA: hypothetical protein VFZ43_13305 [Anaerolineales bacterium]